MTIGKLSGQCDFGQKGQSYCNQRGQSCVAKRVKVAWLFQEHRKEIEQFAEIAQRDNIKFSHITYQEVIMKLSKEFYEGNEDYLNYITDRYL